MIWIKKYSSTRLKTHFSSLALFISVLMLFNACHKDSLITDADAQLDFSHDTITFDTVFTSLGSTTEEFRIINTHNKTIRISTLTLAGGDASPYELNVDGVSGTSFQDIDIPAKDSIYVFVKVNIDPTSSNAPFLVTDHVTMQTNGNTQQVVLQAYGQNAYYHKQEVICGATWYADKPHFIVDYVFVDSLCDLTLKPGCKIYVQSNYIDPDQVKGRILIQGNLHAMGTKDSIITFQGSRLEAAFAEDPGQWNGLELLRDGGTSEISYAYIKGATNGIVIDAAPAVTGASNLILNQVEFAYMSGSAILGFTSKVRANNILVRNCGGQGLSFVNGGDIMINHATLVRGSDKGLLGFSNNLTIGTVVYSVEPFMGVFENCIIYGSQADEVVYNENPTASMSYTFRSCLLKTTDDQSSTHYVDCLFNEDPLFEDWAENDFRLKTGSPCINTGIYNGFTTIDLLGNPRDSQPDMGCYEY